MRIHVRQSEDQIVVWLDLEEPGDGVPIGIATTIEDALVDAETTLLLALHTLTLTSETLPGPRKPTRLM
jgi:hypothetical protein